MFSSSFSDDQIIDQLGELTRSRKLTWGLASEEPIIYMAPLESADMTLVLTQISGAQWQLQCIVDGPQIIRTIRAERTQMQPLLLRIEDRRSSHLEFLAGFKQLLEIGRSAQS